MPRHPDPSLEKRIVDAAWRLWQRGDRHLSLRSLAEAAGTNTPTIYRRFRSRKGIVRALLLRLRTEFLEAVTDSQTIAEAVGPYIDFALRHPQQYELYFAQQHRLLRQWLPGRRVTPEEKMPGFFWALQKLSEQFGGSPQDHIPLAIAVWSQVHGTASLLISGVVEIDLQLDLRVRCEETVRSLIQERAKPLRETGQIRAPLVGSQCIMRERPW